MIMGDVIVIFRVLPKIPEKFEEIKKAVEALKPERLEEDPIGFGITALKATFFVHDGGNQMNELEANIEGIENTEVETLSVTRSL